MTTPTTALDLAHAAMQAAPDDAAARLRYYERLADGELFMLLAAEVEGDNLVPKVFDLEGGPVVLGSIWPRPARWNGSGCCSTAATRPR